VYVTEDVVAGESINSNATKEDEEMACTHVDEIALATRLLNAENTDVVVPSPFNERIQRILDVVLVGVIAPEIIC
jgi:hypothetical protein